MVALLAHAVCLGGQGTVRSNLVRSVKISGRDGVAKSGREREEWRIWVTACDCLLTVVI
jgi:hypothetical protein